MIKILAHRGYWNKEIPKNSRTAFLKAFSLGYGIETDLRDFNGDIVISHDPPKLSEEELLNLDDFLDLFKKENSKNTLALNIKSDGIKKYIMQSIYSKGIENYFLFDMSIPDMMDYLHSELNVYARKSQFEDPSLFKNLVKGIWVDSFSEDYYGSLDLDSLFEEWENLAIVSPELHSFNIGKFWEKLKNTINKHPNRNVYLCTDYPNQASLFFNNAG
tara:strand:+ start:125 stop:775 length:651 start_codon:yes stop_codon:yes gene_type:complete